MNPDPDARRRIVGRIVQKKKRSRWYVLTLEVIEAPEEKDNDADHFDDDETDEAPLSTQVVYISKATASSSCSYHEFALYIHSIIAVTGHLVDRLPSLEGDDLAAAVPLHRSTEFFLVEQWKWIQCPPDLHVIAGVLQILRRDANTNASSDLISVLVPYDATPEYPMDQLQRRLCGNETISVSQLQHWILRGLQGGGGSAVSRQRRPRASRADRELLLRLKCDEKEPHFVPLVVPNEASISLEPRPFAQPQSARGPLTRQEYMQRKKEPQVQWLLQRVVDVLAHHMRHDSWRILDIGGGRGDVAVQLARRLPQAQITVVDRNPLTACAEWAAQHGVRLTLRQADFLSFMTEHGEERWDCVVAWHACGDLTDAALLYAQRTASALIICPCCYNKTLRPDVFIPPYHTTLEKELQSIPDELPRIQRLAETSQDAATSRRAAQWINGRRIAAMAPGWRLRLEEFPFEYSARNLVLVGTKE
jgi:Methyltransferase domain